MIHIPFDEKFREPMLSGRMTMVAQTRRYGVVGDQFEAWGQSFELILVGHMALLAGRDLWYAHEGFKSRKDFERMWAKLHPRKGFVPEQLVWLHEFKRVQP